MKLKTKLQDEDFELGEVSDVDITTMPDGCFKANARNKRGVLRTFYYNTKADFDNDWEDAPEEPREYWTVSCGTPVKYTWYDDEFDRATEAVGLKFDTKEECERAIEKMKAWRRLSNKGFKFELWDYEGGNYQERIKTGRILFRVKDYEENDKDLDLLFSGGEE